MKRIIFSSVLTVLICLSCCSCALNPENTAFSHEYIVSALGFDFENGEYLLTLETIVINSEDFETPKSTMLIKGKGKSPESALNNAVLKSVMPIELSHCAVTVIAENVDSAEFSEICTFLENQPQISLSMLLISAVSAEQLLSLKPVTSVATGYDIATLAANRSLKEGINFKNRLYEISQKRRNEIPVFSLPFFETNDEQFSINGINIYQNDAVLMHIGNELLPFYAVACDTQSKGEILVDEKSLKIEKSYTVCTLKNREIPQIRLVCDLEITGGKETENIFKTKIKELFLLSQENETDIFGIGNLLYQKEETFFKKIKNDYSNYYKNFELSVTVK